jgi:hypothetical protein
MGVCFRAVIGQLPRHGPAPPGSLFVYGHYLSSPIYHTCAFSKVRDRIVALLVDRYFSLWLRVRISDRYAIATMQKGPASVARSAYISLC